MSILFRFKYILLNENLLLWHVHEGSKWEVVEDKEVRHRYKNKIDPVPSFIDDLKAFFTETTKFDKIDNDKFSITPRPVTEIIDIIVKKA